MKHYDEITQDLLQRRQTYLAQQKKRRKTAIGVATGLCGCCAIALLGFGIGNMGTGKQPNTDISASKPAVTVTQPQNTEDIPTQEETMPQPEHKIVVHPMAISEVPSQMGIARLLDDFVEMTREEMTAYYGMDYVPEVPEDMKPLERHSGIFKRNGGTGEIYWDEDELRFFNEDQTRDMSLRVRKGGMPFVDQVVFTPDMEASVICDAEVMIGQVDSGGYYAEFLYQNVGFMLYADGLTLEEFVAVIASIVKT